MASRLRMGVIGLGRRWPRYRQAVQTLRSQVRVRAVHDPAPARAEAEARALGCAAAGGVVELLERDDVDAVLLLGGPWFGLWPLGQACRVNKPVLCAAAPVGGKRKCRSTAGQENSPPNLSCDSGAPASRRRSM